MAPLRNGIMQTILRSSPYCISASPGRIPHTVGRSAVSQIHGRNCFSSAGSREREKTSEVSGVVRNQVLAFADGAEMAVAEPLSWEVCLRSLLLHSCYLQEQTGAGDMLRGVKATGCRKQSSVGTDRPVTCHPGFPQELKQGSDSTLAEVVVRSVPKRLLLGLLAQRPKSHVFLVPLISSSELVSRPMVASNLRAAHYSTSFSNARVGLSLTDRKSDGHYMNSSSLGGAEVEQKYLAHTSHRAREARPYYEVGRGQALVDHVCNILRQRDNWAVLTQMSVTLDPYHVGEVLKRQTDASLAHDFFLWAKGQVGFQHNAFTYNIMMRLLTIARDFNMAERLVEEMYTVGCKPDVITFTTLIKGYGAANRYEEAFEILKRMRVVGCKPNTVTYLVVMNIYAKTGAVDEAWELFEHLQEKGVQPNSTIYSLMINCLGKAGNLVGAYALFTEMKLGGCVPDVVAYTNIIDLHSKAGLHEKAIDLYKEMLQAGVKPDIVTFCAVMDCLGKAGDVTGASRIFHDLKARGYQPDAVAYTTIIDIHSKAGYFNKAVRLFKEMREAGVQPNTFNYNSMLDCYGRAGDVTAAMALFQQMKRSSCVPDLTTYGILMCHHAKLGLLEPCLQLLDDLQQAGLQPNSIILIAMVDCLGKVGNFSAALDLFLQMKEKGCSLDVVFYTRMIDICGKCGYYEKAVEFYDEMQKVGVEPNIFTYNTLINCLGKYGNHTAAHQLFCEMQQRGCEPNVVTYNTLIDLYSKAGKPELSMEIFSKLQAASGIQPDSGTFITMMETLSKAGQVQEVENMFWKMKEAGHDVRLPAYNILIDMWGKAGNIEKLSFWHKDLLDSGLTPDYVTLRSMISTYLRVHMYDAVKTVIDTMSSLGIAVDSSMSAILLQHCSGLEHQEHVDGLLSVLANTGHPAYAFVSSLIGSRSKDITAYCERFFDSLPSEEKDGKLMFLDALIMFLHNLGCKVEAGCVWDYAVSHDFFPQAVTIQTTPSHWFMDFHTMSVGTALVALTRTLATFRDAMITTNSVPDQVFIITGWGKGSRVPGCSTVKQAVQEKLYALRSPFYVSGMNLGCFVCEGEPFLDWVQQLTLD